METSNKKSAKEIARELGLLRKRPVSTDSPRLKAKKQKSDQPFSHLIIIDFESTCWDHDKTSPQEIIEFPAVLMSTTNGQIEAEFHHYVQPSERPTLSSFCHQLTGISQTQVDDGIPLSICLRKFSAWLRRLQRERGIVCADDTTVGKDSSESGQKVAALVTWSDWDLGVCLLYEAKRKQITRPPALNRWIDLRLTYRKFYQRKPDGLNGALQDLGLIFDGREHSGVDDARNTGRVAWRMICDGCQLHITKTLKMAPNGSVQRVSSPLSTQKTRSFHSSPAQQTVLKAQHTVKSHTCGTFHIAQDLNPAAPTKPVTDATKPGLRMRDQNVSTTASKQNGRPALRASDSMSHGPSQVGATRSTQQRCGLNATKVLCSEQERVTQVALGTGGKKSLFGCATHKTMAVALGSDKSSLPCSLSVCENPSTTMSSPLVYSVSTTRSSSLVFSVSSVSSTTASQSSMSSLPTKASPLSNHTVATATNLSPSLKALSPADSSEGSPALTTSTASPCHRRPVGTKIAQRSMSSVSTKACPVTSASSKPASMDKSTSCLTEQDKLAMIKTSHPCLSGHYVQAEAAVPESCKASSVSVRQTTSNSHIKQISVISTNTPASALVMGNSSTNKEVNGLINRVSSPQTTVVNSVTGQFTSPVCRSRIPTYQKCLGNSVTVVNTEVSNIVVHNQTDDIPTTGQPTPPVTPLSSCQSMPKVGGQTVHVTSGNTTCQPSHRTKGQFVSRSGGQAVLTTKGSVRTYQINSSSSAQTPTGIQQGMRAMTSASSYNNRSFITPPATNNSLCCRSSSAEVNKTWSGTSMRATPPLCSCGRRSKRRLVQKQGPNTGRWFFSCSMSTANSSFQGKKSGCKFFLWETPTH